MIIDNSAAGRVKRSSSHPRAASTFPALADAGADAELIALVDRFFAADQEMKRQMALDSRAHAEWNAAHPLPETLRHTPQDAALGIPAPEGGVWRHSFHTVEIERLLPLDAPEMPPANASALAWETYRFVTRLHEERAPEPPARTARVREIIEAQKAWSAHYDDGIPTRTSRSAARAARKRTWRGKSAQRPPRRLPGSRPRCG